MKVENQNCASKDLSIIAMRMRETDEIPEVGDIHIDVFSGERARMDDSWTFCPVRNKTIERVYTNKPRRSIDDTAYTALDLEKTAGGQPKANADHAQELASQAQDLNMGYGCKGQLQPPEVVTGSALTYDEGKAPLAHIPWAAVDEMAMVQAYGQKKYQDWNNYRKGMEVGRNISCALRHIRDYMNGIDNDPESGRSHLGHAMCRIAFVLQNIADKTAVDNRFKP